MLDFTTSLKIFKEKGSVCLKEGNGKLFSIHRGTLAAQEQVPEGIYLLFDLFQIRSLCPPFSEVSLDIVDFASKPSIYQSPANPLLPKGALTNGKVRFTLIKEPSWNKLLFQMAQPVLFIEEKERVADVETALLFPLFNPNTKVLFLGPEGEVKIMKG
jgi:hypothetical protein